MIDVATSAYRVRSEDYSVELYLEALNREVSLKRTRENSIMPKYAETSGLASRVPCAAAIPSSG